MNVLNVCLLFLSIFDIFVKEEELITSMSMLKKPIISLLLTTLVVHSNANLFCLVLLVMRTGKDALTTYILEACDKVYMSEEFLL